jgi:branched-chain amino acid transport system substrate-binding protein
MRRKKVGVGRRPVRGTAVLVLLALAGSACAGQVGKYRNALPRVGSTRPVAETATAAAPAAESATAPADGSAVADAGTNATSPVATASSGGSGSVSGAGGALSRPAATGVSSAAVGGSGSLAGTASTARTGPSGPAPASAAAAAATPTGPGQGGPSPATPSAPAPVPGGGTTTGVTKDTITIGLVYPKTGFYTGLARNAPEATQAAFDEAGPINGRRVVLKTYDDGSENASTIQLEEKRAKDEVFALMSVVSESNVVLAPLADQHKVPVVVGNIDQKVALPLTYAFPVYAFWARMATILPSFIKNVLGGAGKKIGIVYEGTSTATDAKNAFKDKAKELGLTVVFEQPIAVSQSTCANEVSNLQAHGVEVVYMMNGPLGAICMLRDARALAYHPTWTGVGTSWSFNAVAQASGGGADGIRTISTTTTLDTPAGRHYSEVMRKYAPNSGADGDDLTMLWYALAKTTVEALRRAGPNLSREGFVETMETKMSGYDSGYLPPPTFGPKIRYGPTTVGVHACCTDGRWTTPQLGWRAEF